MQQRAIWVISESTPTTATTGGLLRPLCRSLDQWRIGLRIGGIAATVQRLDLAQGELVLADSLEQGVGCVKPQFPGQILVPDRGLAFALQDLLDRLTSARHRRVAGARVEPGPHLGARTVTGPSRDWLNPELGYLAGHRARSKVRAWFNARASHATVARGREAVEKILQREGKTSVRHEDLARELGFDAADALFEAVGKDEFSLRQIEALYRGGDPANQQPDAPLIKAPTQGAKKAGGGVLVVGVDSLMTQMARCCKPAPPDPILGFVTRGKGVSVHRADCSNVREFMARNAERVIDVQWGQPRAEKAPVYPVDVIVQALDRQGLLRDISEVFLKEKMNVIGVQTQTVRETAWLTFTVEVADARAAAAGSGSGHDAARRALGAPAVGDARPARPTAARHGKQHPRSSGRDWRRHQHEVADVLFLQEFGLRLGDSLQRKGLRHQWPDGTAFDGCDQVGKHRLVPCRATNQADVVQVQAAHVQRHHRPCDGTGGHIPATAA